MSDCDADSRPVVLQHAEAVRKRPGMYFGDFEGAPNRVIYEVVANAIDQYVAGFSTKVAIELDNNRVRVSDDGIGMPFDKPASDDGNVSMVEHYLSSLHVTPTADQHAPHIHINALGVGLCGVNAVCQELDIISRNGTHCFKQSFGKGESLSECEVENCDLPSGTTIELVIDDEVFDNHFPDRLNLRKTMFELAHFYPGLTIEFQKERFCAENGLLDLALIHYKDQAVGCARNNLIRFSFSGTLDQIQIVVAAIGKAEDNSDTHYISWVNGFETVLGGVHIESLSSAFSKVGWKPSIALIHTIMHEPQYAGPSKDALISVEAGRVIGVLLEEPLRKAVS